MHRVLDIVDHFVNVETQLPMFTCSWKFLCVSCLRPRAASIKLSQTQQCLRKMWGNFQHRGGSSFYILMNTLLAKTLQWVLWPKILLTSGFWIKLDYSVFWTLGQHYMSSLQDIICSSYIFLCWSPWLLRRPYNLNNKTMLTTMQEDWLTIWLLWLTEKWQGQPVRSRTGGG